MAERAIHDLKCWPEFFNDVFLGLKTFELREDDRQFQKGDGLMLREWDPKTEQYTGHRCDCRVTHILRWDEAIGGIDSGYCIMSIKLIDRS